MSASAESENKKGITVVFLAHQGVQHMDIWEKWRDASSVPVSFVLCQEKIKQITFEDFFGPNLTPIVQAVLKDEKEKLIKMKHNNKKTDFDYFFQFFQFSFQSGWEKFWKMFRKKLRKHENFKTLINEMRFIKQKIYKMKLKYFSRIKFDYVIDLNAEIKSNCDFVVPQNLLKVSEWSSPEIPSNTAAALQYAVKQTESNLFWLVSGYDVPLISAENLKPFCNLKSTQSPLDRFKDNLYLLDDTFLRYKLFTEFKSLDLQEQSLFEHWLKFYEQYSSDEDSSNEENALQKPFREQSEKYKILMKKFKENNIYNINEISILPQVPDSTVEFIENLQQYSGMQWMCLSRDIADFVGKKLKYMEALTFLYYENFVTGAYYIKHYPHSNNFPHSPDEYFIQSLVGFRNGAGNAGNAQIIPSWTPFHSHKVTSRKNMIIRINNEEHYLQPSYNNLKNLITFEYWSWVQNNPEAYVVTFRKLDQQYTLDEADFDFLLSIWKGRFPEKENTNYDDIVSKHKSQNRVVRQDDRGMVNHFKLRF